MRVYIAGPMRGVPEYNHPAFHNAAAVWRAHGWEVVSPAELDAAGDVETYDFAAFMRRDLAELVKCDALAVLPCWEQSQGACCEVFVATKALGIPVYNAFLGTFVDLDYDVPQERIDAALACFVGLPA